jgi:intracellular septation protein A
MIKDVFVRMFDVDPGSALEFRTRAHLMDQNVIEQGLGGQHGDDTAELPTAYSQGRQLETSGETRAGCVKMLAGVLLLPLPFMIAYLEFGYLAASAVLVSVIVFREMYRRWKKSKGGSRFGDVLKVGLLLLTGATIVLRDPLYLQLIPTAALLVVAIAELLAVSLNLPHLSAFHQAHLDGDPRTARALLSFAIIAPCVGGAAINEYLRMNVALDTWVWFFAFFRIELILGFLVSSIPLLYYMVQHVWRTDDDSDSP